MTKEITGWEDEFDKQFRTAEIPELVSSGIKYFITQQIASAVEAERARIKQEVQTIIDTKGYESGDVVLGVIKFLESI